MNKIESIAETSSGNLKRLMVDAAEQIEAAMIKAVEEAQLQDKDAVFKLGFTISLNLDTNKMDNDLSWSVRHKLSVSDDMPDPNQLKLSIEEEPTVRLGDNTQVPLSVAKELVREIKKGRAAK